MPIYSLYWFSRPAPVSRNPDWLQGVRDRAQALIQEQALPTTRDEDWRFTDLSSLYQIPFQSADQAQVEASTLASLNVTDQPLRLVFVNGGFAPQLSNQAEMPTAISFSTLSNLEDLTPGRSGPTARGQRGVYRPQYLQLHRYCRSHNRQKSAGGPADPFGVCHGTGTGKTRSPPIPAC